MGERTKYTIRGTKAFSGTYANDGYLFFKNKLVFITNAKENRWRF